MTEENNIVLIGMPGCGKSTLGALLARRLGRASVNTDAEIVRQTGMPITEIFRTRGEAYFRDLETEVLRSVCRSGGKVIAAGGGAALRAENVAYMKQSGVVVFLDRPLETLRPSPERPLGDTYEKLRKLYETRYPIYAAAADVTVDNNGTVKQAAETILNP